MVVPAGSSKSPLASGTLSERNPDIYVPVGPAAPIGISVFMWKWHPFTTFVLDLLTKNPKTAVKLRLLVARVSPILVLQA